MNYRGLLYKYYTTAFDNVNLFDTFSFQEVEKLFLENQKQILDTNLWRVEDTLNRDSFIKKDLGKKYQFAKGSLYPKEGDQGSFKPDITSKTVTKETYYNGKVVYLSIPREIINKYQTGCLENSNLNVVRQYVKEAEEKNIDLEELAKKYQTIYGATSLSDFSILWYNSIKNDGIMHPGFYFDSKFLSRGTHKSYLGAIAGYDYAFFHTFEEDKFSLTSAKTSSGRKYFLNGDIRLEVDIKNKRIDYYLNDSNKFIGKLKI
tara:strand:+ start:6367 stop:7149 length:783 start_codon:yes stop_codon:yes gene_type:complete